MAKVYLSKDMDITKALKKFKQQLDNEGTLKDCRNREYFMSKKQKRILKQKLNQKRLAKRNK